MHISDFDYKLPTDLIAREPARPRDASRMLVLNARTGERVDSVFRKLPEFLAPSDVLVINNTRVVRARIRGKLQRRSGSTREVEILFAAPLDGEAWEVMCRPGKRVRPGDRAVLGGGEIEGTFGELREHGLRSLHLNKPELLASVLDRHGRVPLPPYMEREDREADVIEYQTVYANTPGSIAAPTAGLHFSESVFAELRNIGVEILQVTLHVGVGTFIPVRADDPRHHVLRREHFEMSPETADRLNAARVAGRRVIAVGTTTTRTLEYVIGRYGHFEPGCGRADLFVLPGYRFRAVDAMLTNFHLPRSTLLMLVSAFASREKILDAYHHAMLAGYRFYSYGDCMLILGSAPHPR